MIEEMDDKETFDTVEHLFAEFDKEDLKWQKEHPFRAYIRNWLDKRFPRGIAGGYRAYYAILRPWKILRHIRYQLKYAHQRIFRGWDDSAVWNINYYLAKLIPQLLRKLKENGNGLPGFVFEGLPYENENTYTYSDENWKIAVERWDKVLDEMIDGFEAYIKYDEEFDYKTPREEDENYRKFQRALDLLKEHFESLWD